MAAVEIAGTVDLVVAALDTAAEVVSWAAVVAALELTAAAEFVGTIVVVDALELAAIDALWVEQSMAYRRRHIAVVAVEGVAALELGTALGSDAEVVSFAAAVSDHGHCTTAVVAAHEHCTTAVVAILRNVAFVRLAQYLIDHVHRITQIFLSEPALWCSIVEHTAVIAELWVA